MQIETELRTSQLYDACHVLFGSDIDVSVDFLQYLEIPGLKAVYRRKALETHPDRAIALALPPVTLEEQFKKINSAYHELHDYLENPLRFQLIDDGFRRRPNPTSHKMHALVRHTHQDRPMRDRKHGARFTGERCRKGRCSSVNISIIMDILPTGSSSMPLFGRGFSGPWSAISRFAGNGSAKMTSGRF